MSILRFLIPFLCIIAGSCDGTEPPESVSQETTTQVKPDPPVFAGREACAACHAKEAELYRGSHHDLAMQTAGTDTVLGDFGNSTFIYNGITTTFFRRDGDYYVRTDGPSGNLDTYRIKYTFGVEPLQQYLVEFPGGRLQALSIAWDSRSLENGGQRWFHLYPNEQIDYRDVLHWTGINQNWNNMCAECHSTNLQKNYHPDTHSYTTRWSEIDVSCEACHGPGSRHIQLARERTAEDMRNVPAGGLAVDFPDTSSRHWIFSDTNPIAELEQPGSKGGTDRLIDVCGPCHSRRTTIDPEDTYGKSLHDTHIVSFLTPGLYHDDGQINDEVYVYGSFVQSRMYQAGVTCNDCHDPHSLRLKREGNELCLLCHRRENYDSSGHHFHETGSEASRCISCHMPAKNFMVIDVRRDHSLRIPRPDLSIKTGAPNACNLCHGDQTAQWAQKFINRWYKKPAEKFNFAEAFRWARNGRPGAGPRLLQVIDDNNQPAIVRATALSFLAAFPARENLNAVRNGITSPDPLIRRASLSVLANLDPEVRYRFGSRLLKDPVKSVRIEAARLLAGVATGSLPQQPSLILNKAIEEYVDTQMVNADRGFAHTNLGNLYSDMQQFNRAEQAYKTALDIEPGFIPAWINLADLYRRQERETEAESVLRSALRIHEISALLHHALGLCLIRQKKYVDGMNSLERAARLEPDNAQFTLVFAIALNSRGEPQRAISELQGYDKKFPSNWNVLMTLATMNRDAGKPDAALTYARQLLELSPGDNQLIQLVKSLERKSAKNH